MLSILTLGLLLAAEAPKPTVPKELAKAIEDINDAFHKADADKLRALMTEDHMAVTPYYPAPGLDRAALLKALPDHKLSEYKLGKLKITMLTADVALVTYPLRMKGTYKGKEVPAKSVASGVWVRRDGKWVEAFYQETEVKD
jgi:ketosteroid isomerase-like protein